MARKRSFKLIVIVVIFVILSASGFAGYVGYSFYFRPLPKTSGAREVDGLHNSVSIYRDTWGIPQIFASNPDDLFFAQGYVQAQERWWQMELSRFLGMGRLREILTSDESVLDADRWMLTLGLADAAKADWERASPEARAALTAFSAGINAYIQDRSVESLATEYGLIGLAGQYDNLLAYLGRDVTVEPWEPYHSLLLFKLFAWGMDGNLWSELERPTLVNQLSPALLTSYQPGYPYSKHPTVVSLDELGINEAALEPGTSAPLLPPGVAFGAGYDALSARLVGSASPELMALLGFRPRLGGNAWVVSGIHTHSGKPLLANDLQMPIEIPSPWFEVGLHCTTPSNQCPYVVVGFSLPGIPGVIVGHNDQIAWGMNASQADVQDVYLLRLNPEEPTQYEVDGQWVNMEEQRVIFEQSGEQEPPLEYSHYRTRFGPVISDLTDVFAEPVLTDGGYQAMALRWTALEPGDPLAAILALNRAQNWNEFRAALSGWNWPAMNFVYADVAGNIGYQVSGALPVRTALHSGLTPVPAAEPRYSWQGMVPFELLPSVYNPADGIIVDSSNAIVAPDYYTWLAQRLAERDPTSFPNPADLNVVFSQEWWMGFQAARINALLDAVQKHSVDSFAQIQGDLYNSFAAEVVSYVFVLNFDTPEFQEMLDWFKTWDLQSQMDNPQAALFAAFWVELLHLTFADQLGLQRDGFDVDMWALVELLTQPDHQWWDDSSTPFTHETRDDILRQAFIAAYAGLTDRLGTERSEWSWGKLHQGKFVSRIIGHKDFLNNPAIDSGPFPLNQGPFAINGGVGTINATLYTTVPGGFDEPFTVVALPSYRLIVDLGEFRNSRAMHTTGQSGHPASDNYNDMIVPWRTVEYHDVRWGANDIPAEASKRLDLRPQ